MQIPKTIADRIHFKRTTAQESINTRVERVDPVGACEYCGSGLSPHIHAQVLHHPSTHWRKNCTTCGRYYVPSTGTWEQIDIHTYNTIFKGWSQDQDK